MGVSTRFSSNWNAKIIRGAFIDACYKFSPWVQIKNPVMFCVYLGACLSSLIFFQAIMPDSIREGISASITNGIEIGMPDGIADGRTERETAGSFILAISLWLWFTVFFANLAEALAEGRGKAQAQTLRNTRSKMQAKKLDKPKRNSKFSLVEAADLKMGNIVLVEAGDMIPSDGEVIEGMAFVNESAISGESAPVIRESGGDRNSVTGGTEVISDWLIVQITAGAGETFLDRIIALVEGAKRGKTPNEIALTILLAALTLVFLLVCSTLLPFSNYTAQILGTGYVAKIIFSIALFVCLAPTTIASLLSAIGIAGIDRMIQSNVIALSGRAIEAAGDVDILLLDKTGTITLGNREATAFLPSKGVNTETLAEAAQLASLADETPEGRSIVILAKETYGIREREMTSLQAVFIPFSAQSCMSGVDFGNRKIRKGSEAAIGAYLKKHGGSPIPEDVKEKIIMIANQGGTPLVVIDGTQVLGLVHLKDIVKGKLKERFAELRQMGIKTMMITGDNHLTAAAIALEAGVDDFLADAKPEDKINLIRQFQADGHMVAMTGDGTNDAPALAQADVALAMNTGTQAAKEAGNLIDLDSNPTKLIEVVSIGKQLLMTRGALTTFSVANDLGKYFAILPALLIGVYPELKILNIMQLHSPHSAVLSAVIFNALIIIILIPLALRGISYRHESASKLLRKNVFLYGFGGLLTPFIGIKLIDELLVLIGLNMG